MGKITRSRHIRTSDGETVRVPMGKKKVRRKKAASSSSASSGLSNIVQEVNKKFGESTIVKGAKIRQPERIPTGIFSLDLCLVGGIPHNRISMLIGQKSAGKTTVGYKIAAHAQSIYDDQQVVWMDLEHTFEDKWSSELGVDVDNLLVVHPDTGEQAVDIAEMVVNSKETSLLVVDSIPALTPLKEYEGAADDILVGAQARLTGKMIRKLTTSLLKERKRNHYVTIVFINQFRSRIGGPPSFGEPTSVPGGKAMEYCTTLQLTIKKSQEKVGKDADGVDRILYNEHAFSITKNKMNQGPRSGEFTLIRYDDPDRNLFSGDIDDVMTMFQYAKRFGYLTGAARGQKLEIAGKKYPFNKEESALWLYQDRETYVRLRNQLIRRQAVNLGMPEDFIASFEV